MTQVRPETAEDLVMGAVYEDVVTGFSGTVTGWTRWITGCDSACLQPNAKKNQPQESRWYDVTRLRCIGAGCSSDVNVQRAQVRSITIDPGGPQETPRRDR